MACFVSIGGWGSLSLTKTNASKLRSARHQLRSKPQQCIRKASMIAMASPSPSVSASSSTYTSTHARDQEYDYVIVGGGAAGCVLANRLSANKANKVLIIEAGDQGYDFRVSVPLGFPYLPGSDLDWKFLSEPEEQLNGRRVYFPRGKMLGGSHAMSVMLYHRGSAKDFETWEEMGADGWGPDDVLSFFKKSEHNHQMAQSGFHAKGGPLTVSNLRTLNPMSQAFLNACTDTGLKANPDFNDWNRSQEGVGAFQVTQREGMRETPYTAFLRPVMNRSNLTVITRASVERVLIDEQTKTAYGVSYMNKDERRVVVRARKEVILAAGSYGSPQLLMLSGIGDKDMLKNFNIPVMQHSPGVGQNLQDQPGVMLSYLSPNPYSDKSKSNLYYTEKTGKNLGTLLQYLMLGSGPLTSPMCEAGGFVKTSQAQDGQPDLQLRFIPFVSEPDPYHSLGDFATGGDYLTNKSNRPAGFTLQSVVARPQSRGFIQLRSGDYRDRPEIVSNWLTDERDLKSMVEGIKLCRTIAQKADLASFRGKELYPGPNATSDEQLATYVRESCHTANAIVGTCRMGSKEDDLAVVDPKLRVKGIKNLRVVDSSVMPTITGGQTGAPTFMISERGADFILATANKS